MANPYKLKKTADKMISDMIDRQGYISCQYCGKSRGAVWEVHHLIFRSESPKHPNLHHKDNLLICCHECHAALHKEKSLRRTIVAERKLYDLFPDILSLRL